MSNTDLATDTIAPAEGLYFRDLNLIEQINLEESSVVIGGGCYHDGRDFEDGEEIVSGGKKYRCKEKNNGSYKWKRIITLGDVIGLAVPAVKFISSL